MKVASLALAILLCAPQEDAAKKAARLDRALGWLANEDADVREMGRKEILGIGADAIPAIEKKLAEKGANDLVQLLRKLEHASSGADTWVSEQDLKELEADEQYRKEAEKLPKDVAEKYLYVKYHEALAYVRRKNYQRAFDMANGLIALDHNSKHLDDFKRLRRHCEGMITQTSLVEAKILQPKVWYLEGETVELSARMKNVYKAMMTLTWEKGTEKEPGGGVLLMDVDVTMNDLGGASISDQRHQELRFEEEIPIAPGAQWERKFTLDTTTTVSDSKQIKVIKVGGWSQPGKMATDGVNITRRIQFEPAIVKILPKKYERFTENPLEWLEKMIAEGDPQEIYVCTQLLEGADRDKGTEMLIKLLTRSNTLTSKTYAANLLTALTGQNWGIDPRRWENWFNNKPADKDKKKK
ncbi:MAG TPA: hypothetical protein VNM14_14335 [Planctomycetota bacterium]|jgi:hypothetical protein|nr:hypothetical protein [Planctomycetota bacterium]